MFTYFEWFWDIIVTALNIFRGLSVVFWVNLLIHLSSKNSLNDKRFEHSYVRKYNSSLSLKCSTNGKVN